MAGPAGRTRDDGDGFAAQLPSLFTLPEVHADPYPLFTLLRSMGAVNGMVPGASVITRCADALAVLHHPAASSDESRSDLARLSAGTGSEPGPFARMKDRFLLMSDPPSHTRVRSLIQSLFSAGALERLRPRIQAIVDERLESLEGAGSMDLIADFAYPIPVSVICELVGVPPDQSLVRQWARDLAGGLELRPFRSEEAERRADGATVKLLDYLRALVSRQRASPTSDVLSALLRRDEDGESLDVEELYATCILLLLAGHETTANLIGNGTLALLQHPDELSRLRTDPTIRRSAIEELLRFESPVQVVQRVAIEPISVGDGTVPKGNVAIVLLGAVNRDPARFADPDRLHLTRWPNSHLAFSGGIHFCVGAALARLEGQVAIPALMARFPELALATDRPEWRPSIVLRGLERLPVTW